MIMYNSYPEQILSDEADNILGNFSGSADCVEVWGFSV